MQLDEGRLVSRGQRRPRSSTSKSLSTSLRGLTAARPTSPPLPCFQLDVGASLRKSLEEEAARRAGQPPFDLSISPEAALSRSQQNRNARHIAGKTDRRSSCATNAHRNAKCPAAAASRVSACPSLRGREAAAKMRVIPNDIAFAGVTRSPIPAVLNVTNRLPSPQGSPPLHASHAVSDNGMLSVQRPHFRYRSIAEKTLGGDASQYARQRQQVRRPHSSHAGENDFCSSLGSVSSSAPASEHFFDDPLRAGDHTAPSSAASSSSTADPLATERRNAEPAETGSPRSGGSDAFFDRHHDASILEQLAGALATQERWCPTSAPQTHTPAPPTRTNTVLHAGTAAAPTSRVSHRPAATAHPNAPFPSAASSDLLLRAIARLHRLPRPSPVSTHDRPSEKESPSPHSLRSRRGRPEGSAPAQAARPGDTSVLQNGRQRRRAKPAGPLPFQALTRKPRQCVCCRSAEAPHHHVAKPHRSPSEQQHLHEPEHHRVAGKGEGTVARSDPELILRRLMRFRKHGRMNEWMDTESPLLRAAYSDPQLLVESETRPPPSKAKVRAWLMPTPPSTHDSAATADSVGSTSLRGRRPPRPHTGSQPTTPHAAPHPWTTEEAIQGITRSVMEELRKAHVVPVVPAATTSSAPVGAKDDDAASAVQQPVTARPPAPGRRDAETNTIPEPPPRRDAFTSPLSNICLRRDSAVSKPDEDWNVASPLQLSGTTSHFSLHSPPAHAGASTAPRRPPPAPRPNCTSPHHASAAEPTSPLNRNSSTSSSSSADSFLQKRILTGGDEKRATVELYSAAQESQLEAPVAGGDTVSSRARAAGPLCDDGGSGTGEEERPSEGDPPHVDVALADSTPDPYPPASVHVTQAQERFLSLSDSASLPRLTKETATVRSDPPDTPAAAEGGSDSKSSRHDKMERPFNPQVGSERDAATEALFEGFFRGQQLILGTMEGQRRDEIADREEEARQQMLVESTTRRRACEVSAQTSPSVPPREGPPHDEVDMDAPSSFAAENVPLPPIPAVAASCPSTPSDSQWSAPTPDEVRHQVLVSALSEMHDGAAQRIAADEGEDWALMVTYAVAEEETCARHQRIAEAETSADCLFSDFAAAVLSARAAEVSCAEETARAGCRREEEWNREDLVSREAHSRLSLQDLEILREAARREAEEDARRAEDAQRKVMVEMHVRKQSAIVGMEEKMRAIIVKTYFQILFELQRTIVDFHESCAREEIDRAEGHLCNVVQEELVAHHALLLRATSSPSTAKADAIDTSAPEETATVKESPPLNASVPVASSPQRAHFSTASSSPLVPHSLGDSPKDLEHTVQPDSPIAHPMQSMESASVNTRPAAETGNQRAEPSPREAFAPLAEPSPKAAVNSKDVALASEASSDADHDAGFPEEVPHAAGDAAAVARKEEGGSPAKSFSAAQPEAEASAEGRRGAERDDGEGGRLAEETGSTLSAKETTEMAVNNVEEPESGEAAPQLGLKHSRPRRRRPAGLSRGYDMEALAEDEAREILDNSEPRAEAGGRSRRQNVDVDAVPTPPPFGRLQMTGDAAEETVDENAKDPTDKEGDHPPHHRVTRAGEEAPASLSVLRLTEDDTYPYIYSSLYRAQNSHKQGGSTSTPVRQAAESASDKSRARPLTAHARPSLVKILPEDNGTALPAQAEFPPLVLSHMGGVTTAIRGENGAKLPDAAMAVASEDASPPAATAENFTFGTSSSRSQLSQKPTASSSAGSMAPSSVIGMPVLRRKEHFVRDDEPTDVAACRLGLADKSVVRDVRGVMDSVATSEQVLDSRASFNTTAEAEMRQTAHEDMLQSPNNGKDTPSLREWNSPSQYPSNTYSSFPERAPILKMKHVPAAFSAGGSTLAEGTGNGEGLDDGGDRRPFWAPARRQGSTDDSECAYADTSGKGSEDVKSSTEESSSNTVSGEQKDAAGAVHSRYGKARGDVRPVTPPFVRTALGPAPAAHGKGLDTEPGGRLSEPVSRGKTRGDGVGMPDTRNAPTHPFRASSGTDTVEEDNVSGPRGHEDSESVPHHLAQEVSSAAPLTETQETSMNSEELREAPLQRTVPLDLTLNHSQNDSSGDGGGE